jgi:iron complex outermembrane recepter protein
VKREHARLNAGTAGFICTSLHVDVASPIRLGALAAIAALQAAGLGAGVGGQRELLHERREHAHARHRSGGHLSHGLRRVRAGGWDFAVNLNTTSVTHVASGLDGTSAMNAQQIASLSTTTPNN